MFRYTMVKFKLTNRDLAAIAKLFDAKLLESEGRMNAKFVESEGRMNAKFASLRGDKGVEAARKYGVGLRWDTTHGCGVALGTQHILTAKHVVHGLPSLQEIHVSTSACESRRFRVKMMISALNADAALIQLDDVHSKCPLELPDKLPRTANLYGEYYTFHPGNHTIPKMSHLQFGCYNRYIGLHILHGPGRTGHSGAGVFDCEGRILGFHVTGVGPRKKRAYDEYAEIGTAIQDAMMNASAVGCGILPLDKLRFNKWHVDFGHATGCPQETFCMTASHLS